MSNVGKVLGVNGNMVSVEHGGDVMLNEVGYVKVGDQSLKSEVIRIKGNIAELQVFEMTKGIGVGDEVEFILDIAPGRVFTGKVRSMGFGVSTNETNKGGLPTISQKKGWLQDPQRYPVIITSDEKDIIDLYRLGGQVDVVVYTGNNSLLNSLAALKIRLMSYLSFVR